MKSRQIKFLSLLFVLAASCADDRIRFILPDDVYAISMAYDIGNNGNASDIRLHLNFPTPVALSDLLEVRLVITKSNKVLMVDEALKLPSGNFLPLTISGNKLQVVKPNAALRDSDGELIGNGKYKVFIATSGVEDSKQLSKGREIILTDRPIFAGDYIGTWEDLGPPGPAVFPMSLRIAEDYSGQMYYANDTFKPFGSGAQDALTTMTVSGATIDAFTLNQLVGGYSNGCAANGTLTGSFEDDINLVLKTFTWSDCDGTRDVKLQFRKQ
jgi:hypothetical protein